MGPDRDPSPWLVVSHDLKEKNKAKPYDPKKSVWVPNTADGGYLEGLIMEKTANKISVLVNGEVKISGTLWFDTLINQFILTLGFSASQ